jgi:hypothetical protein
LERTTAVALGGGTALHLLATVVIGLAALVTVEAAWFGAMFHVEQGRAWQAPGRPGVPTTTPEATMRYRVTWNVEVDADDEGQARTAARQFLLENEDEALSKVVALEDGSAPPDVPKVDAGGTPSI